MSLEEIKKNSDILYKMLEISGDIGFVWDVQGEAVEWIGDIHKILHEDNREEVINFSYINKHINPQDLPKRLQHVHALISYQKNYECDYRIRTAQGETVWLREIGFIEKLANMDAPLYCGIVRDITREKEEVQDLQAIAYLNLGVNMPNLEGFSQLMEDEIKYAYQTNQSGTFFCVGIDSLCAIEEAYDSKITEEVFKQVALRLETLVGREAKIGVLSGDSFGVLIPKLDIENRRYKAFDLIKAFSNKPIKTSEGEVRVTISVGSIEYPRENFSAHSLIQRARTALDSARHFGQSSYYAYDYSNEKRDAFKHWVVTSDDFINAMEDERINLAFQEVIDTSSGKTLFYEALIRMIDQSGEVIPAGMFMPAIEKMGLCRFADGLALRKSIEELTYYPDISLSINVSALSLMSDEWMDVATELLKDRRTVAERLIVEITETVAMKDVEHISHLIDELHKLGCRVALDDFGAGQTSFSQLNILDIDLIKVDSEFVQSMSHKKENKAFLKAMHMLADSFDLPLIIEGVETMEIAEVLQKEGLNNFQGFAYSMPSLERLWLPEDHKDRHLLKEAAIATRA